MKLGKKIKEYRLQKSVTQEQMAAELNISAQAISKWENDVTFPDIQMLPVLSSYFGVTIDDLFEITVEKHFERIENMIWDVRNLPQQDFEYAERFLKEQINTKEEKAHSLQLLAELHNNRARWHHAQAEYYAKEALLINPTCKDNHCALREAQNGTLPDWNIANHHQRIAYYQKFVQEHPDYTGGYLWLMDDLIADGRIEDAADTLERMKQLNPQNERIDMYAGLIAWVAGEHDKAMNIWETMVSNHADNWLVYSVMADYLAKACRYEEAVSYNEKAFALMPAPRYRDMLESQAHLYEIMGKNQDAIHAYHREIELLASEWKITEGETIDAIHREIARLRQEEESSQK